MNHISLFTQRIVYCGIEYIFPLKNEGNVNPLYGFIWKNFFSWEKSIYWTMLFVISIHNGYWKYRMGGLIHLNRPFIMKKTPKKLFFNTWKVQSNVSIFLVSIQQIRLRICSSKLLFLGKKHTLIEFNAYLGIHAPEIIFLKDINVVNSFIKSIFHHLNEDLGIYKNNA